MFDLIQRHQALTRAKHFVKINPETAKLTVADLKMKARKDHTWLEKNCQRFLQNIVGSNSYWKYHVRNRFNALIEDLVIL